MNPGELSLPPWSGGTGSIIQTPKENMKRTTKGESAYAGTMVVLSGKHKTVLEEGGGVVPSVYPLFGTMIRKDKSCHPWQDLPLGR